MLATPMPEPIDRSEVPAAGLVLARAFRDNPGMLAVLRGDPPEVRSKLLARALAAFVEGARRYGTVEVVRVGGMIVATALSFAPTKFPPPIGFQLVTGRGMVRGGLRRMLRAARVDAWMRKLHLREPHYYLNMLGVDPGHQGKGHGGELVRAMSTRADAEHVPCYLETDKESNVTIYRKHGYEVVAERDAPLPELRLWFMQRAAR